MTWSGAVVARTTLVVLVLEYGGICGDSNSTQYSGARVVRSTHRHPNTAPLQIAPGGGSPTPSNTTLHRYRHVAMRRACWLRGVVVHLLPKDTASQKSNARGLEVMTKVPFTSVSKFMYGSDHRGIARGLNTVALLQEACQLLKRGPCRPTGRRRCSRQRHNEWRFRHQAPAAGPPAPSSS